MFYIINFKDFSKYIHILNYMPAACFTQCHSFLGIRVLSTHLNIQTCEAEKL